MSSVVDGRKALAALRGKGFRDSKSSSKDHIWVSLWVNGKLTPIKTKFSHNGQDLDNYLIKCVSKQIRLTKPEFLSYVECHISEEAYINLMVERGHISQ